MKDTTTTTTPPSSDKIASESKVLSGPKSQIPEFKTFGDPIWHTRVDFESYLSYRKF
jgi:hypothetical protein